ncbi:LOW QUALITY PROTEIN: glucocorticoid modulatory element-binding protein 1 [Phycodurus eques]|uniref:LOW QUALITY PROTEIN: glucocorticoid modulatory element-binding protein 1 n=1 Tax=Phycodurus eques TaxID=693459 RepID=UPI002ACEE308|nr:LOW QUALITY PROTEIN: glucocorticoid modulatory element-binding protein 1 [Phycodurus eques]
MATTEDGTISTEEVVVVKPDGERNIEDLNNTQVIIQLQSNTAREEFDGTPMSGMADEEHPEETEGGDVEIGCPITCGDSKATLLVKKFVCPGINVKCVKYDDQLISPKQFVHISGKATLKDWKRAIRMGGVMLRKIMDSGQLDFYQHTTLCTNTCRSTKFDLLINNTRFPPDNSGLSSASSQAQESFGNKVRETERPSEKADWSSSSAKSVNKESHDISEDTLNFWKGIADVGLLGEVVTKISTELLDLLNSLHLLKESVVLQNTEVAVLSNLGQVFGLLNSVKKMVVKRRLQTDPSQEQILGILCKLELQLAEQRKQQQIQALLSCPHPAKTITTVKRQTKRPRLQRPVTTNTLLTSSINHQPSLTPQLFTLLSPISLPSFGQPFTVAGLPITSLAQSSNTVTLLPTGSQLFTQYMVTEDGKADSITLHTSSNLTLVNTSPMHDSSQFGSMVKPVELLHLSQPDVCAEAVPIEAQVLDGAMLMQQESMQGEEVEASQEHTVIEISPCSGEGVGVMVQQQTGESARDKAGLVQRRMAVTIADEQEAQKREVQELELGANGHVPAVQIAVVKENTQEERLPS